MSAPVPQSYPLYVGVTFPGRTGVVVFRVVAWQPLGAPTDPFTPIVTEDDSPTPHAHPLRSDGSMYSYAHTHGQALSAAHALAAGYSEMETP